MEKDFIDLNLNRRCCIKADLQLRNNSRASSSNTHKYSSTISCYWATATCSSELLIVHCDARRKFIWRPTSTSSVFICSKRKLSDFYNLFTFHSYLIFVRCSKQEQRYFNRNGVHTHTYSSSVHDRRTSSGTDAVPAPHLIHQRTCCVHILLRLTTYVTHPQKIVHQKQVERPSTPAH